MTGASGRLLYRVTRVIVLSLCRVLFRVRIRGLDLVPTGGPFIVAPSHRSLLDIPFAAFVTRRRICFMAKNELYENRAIAWVIDAFGGFPVERGAADRAALRAAQAVLERGELLALFPEGTRGHGTELGPLFHGAAFLAARCHVPVVPVGIAGTEEILPSGKVWPSFRRVTIVVGKPVIPPVRDGRVRREEIGALTDTLSDELQAAFVQAIELGR